MSTVFWKLNDEDEPELVMETEEFMPQLGINHLLILQDRSFIIVGFEHKIDGYIQSRVQVKDVTEGETT